MTISGGFTNVFVSTGLANIHKKCDDCEFSSNSITLLLNHKERERSKMRKRLSCDQCGFKTTTNAVLNKHVETIHIVKDTRQSKRKSCDLCNKKFNKESNLNDHLRKYHKQTIIQEIQISNNKQ